MTYERTVAAAVAETKSKFKLAEALAEDIPPRRGRTAEDETSTRQYLEEASQKIADAGGEKRSASYLGQYRATALWVMEPETFSFRWVPDASFTAHNEARTWGMSYDDFAAMPTKSTGAIRELTGKSPYGQRHEPDVAIAAWSSEQKSDAAKALLAEPEVAEQVIEDKQARAVVNRATDEHYAKKAAARTDRTERKAAEDGTDKRVEALLWVNRLGEAQERYSRDVNEALRHVGELPESERYWLTGATDRAESSLRATRRYAELGKSEFDAELETLLANGT